MQRFRMVYLAIVLCYSLNGFAGENGEPLYHWIFTESNTENGMIRDVEGRLNARHLGKPMFYTNESSEYMELDGISDALQLSDNIQDVELPEKEISVEAVIRFRQNGSWKGIIGAFQDNGSFERGWILGLDGDEFYFSLASTATSDLTYLDSGTEAVEGQWYYVTGTYDGRSMKLYINGEMIRKTEKQSGDIFYPEKAWFMIGAYRDDNEYNRINASLREIKVYDRVLSADEIRKHAETVSALTNASPQVSPPSDILVGPYLQFATDTSIRILWETKVPATAKVEYGPEVPFNTSKADREFKTFHEVELTGLSPESDYFYRIFSESEEGEVSSSKVYSFQTTVKTETAFAFGILSDTQSNPDVWGRISGLLFDERPNFAVLAGDLVGTGSRKDHWLDDFLTPAHELMSRVPIYSILGNHEGDADFYYKYMSNPEPEYYYTFSYGNAQFFLIDTNRDVDPGSEQYTWLEDALKQSDATWKFAVHHHPPYSSDEDDYGDAYSGPSDRGDKSLQPLVQLYDTYDLDMCIYGHIHDYERTWPLKNNKVDPVDGVVYLQTGGGGGSLEDYAPTRSFFTRKVHRDHNFLIANIYKNICEIQAIDHNGIVFDQFELTKNPDVD